MPLFWRDLPIMDDAGDIEAAYYPVGRPITLDVYIRGIYQKLSTEGRRAQDSPFASTGRLDFPAPGMSLRTTPCSWIRACCLKQEDMIEITCFAMAVINRHFLPYNVRAKVEWPEAICSVPAGSASPAKH